MEKFVINWNSYSEVFHKTLVQLLTCNEFTDCLLVCEGGQLKAHKFVLSACSPWFRQVLLGIDHPHPVIILQGVKYEELKALMEFVYTGNVTVCENELHKMIEAGKNLKITGLVSQDMLASDQTQDLDKTANFTTEKAFKSCHSTTPSSFIGKSENAQVINIYLFMVKLHLSTVSYYAITYINMIQ